MSYSKTGKSVPLVTAWHIWLGCYFVFFSFELVCGDPCSVSWTSDSYCLCSSFLCLSWFFTWDFILVTFFWVLGTPLNFILLNFFVKIAATGQNPNLYVRCKVSWSRLMGENSLNQLAWFVSSCNELQMWWKKWVDLLNNSYYVQLHPFRK